MLWHSGAATSLRLELDAVAEGYANRFTTLSGYATNVGNNDCAG